MDTKLENLKLTPSLLIELHQRGYVTAGDMAHLSVSETLRIPGMGGRDWRKVAEAQGRDPHPMGSSKRRKA
jgi:hypothetical protein